MQVAGGRRAISGNIGNEKRGNFGFGWFMPQCRKLAEFGLCGGVLAFVLRT
jgi:hypothetical protein